MRYVFTLRAPPRYTMIRPICVFRPIAGNRSLIVLITRNIATTASSCGNICTRTRVSSPTRRPVKRMREKEYAARAPRNTVRIDVVAAMMMVLPNHNANGASGVLRMRA